MRERPRNPIVPGTPKDRTGTRAILRRALAEINRRYDGLQADVLALFDAMPVYSINADDALLVRYGFTPEALNQLLLDLQAALDRWIEAGRKIEHQFWWNPFVEESAAAGTAQSAANLTQVSAVYASARSLDMIVRSDPYRVRIGFSRMKSYEHWSGLQAEARQRLSEVIVRAVADGKNPRAVRTQIMETLKVSRSKAAQYAQTDITDTLRQARWAEADAARDELGIKIGILWTSALLPTTRRTHATRNGKVYSTDEVREFYGKDGNVFNCHCGNTECLLDSEGRPILTNNAKRKFLQERVDWERAQEKPRPP